VAEKLGQILGDATMRVRCAYWATQAAASDAISKAADAMEAQWNNLKQRATA
jgi:hypothetical protein